MKKNKGILLLLLLLLTVQLFPKEGLWMPLLIDKLNYDDLKSNGFKLTPEDIYSINQISLSDAVVIFGRGCTGAIVSENGLLFTNYHCGFGQVQRHTTADNNYIKDGYWAKNRDEELPNPGLSVKILVHISGFTKEVLAGIDTKQPFDKQSPQIKTIISTLEKAIEDTSGYKASIESFYQGNEYYLFLYNEFTDVRLVGAPPEALGAFGGDEDNWVWPRHTADFSVFRVYCGPDGKPARYSTDNIAYQPKSTFKISMKEVNAGDFTMVLGYPGSTEEYLYSAELELIKDVIYPNRIKLRTGQLEIIGDEREKSQDAYIEYAVKQSRLANAWKKWKGVLYGFNRFKVIQKRKDYEQWLVGNAGARKNELLDLYSSYDDVYLGFVPYKTAVDYYNESVFALEPIKLMQNVNELLSGNGEGITISQKESLTRAGTSFFNNYNVELDKKLTFFLLNSFLQDIDESLVPEQLHRYISEDGLQQYVGQLYDNSVFTDQARFNSALEKLMKGKTKVIYEDGYFKLIRDFSQLFSNELIQDYEYYAGQIKNLDKQYMTLLQKIDTARVFYPDANFTMRISYGKVQGYSPSDAIDYGCKTYIDGLIQKASLGDEAYTLPPELQELYQNKDFGSYADTTGRLPLCFLSSNHTSGGNSGSPVLDAYGRLIGLNFDRTWESTMSDFYFDDEICRNITVGMPYILFIIDKYAHAGYLLDEMDIVR
jgi:hypothetical protein